MKEINKVIEKRYIAEDGTEFEFDTQCLRYEQYQKIDFRKEFEKYFVFGEANGDKSKHSIESDYCIQIKSVPEELQQAFYFMFNYDNSLNKYHFDWVLKDNTIGKLWYNTASTDLMGYYSGRNWTEVGYEEDLKELIQNMQEKLVILQKLKED